MGTLYRHNVLLSLSEFKLANLDVVSKPVIKVKMYP